jgi:ABC-type transport system involved in cytochrome bd biosynthesis fused ATPase/permease subunit
VYKAEVIARGPEAYIAMKRVAAILAADETHKYEPVSSDDPTTIAFDHATASWTSPQDDSFTLRELNLQLGKGLHVITGQVGDGKSSVLLALLHEMLLEQGTIRCPISVRSDSRQTAFCAQNAFLASTTIRSNILWGCEYDEHRSVEVVA